MTEIVEKRDIRAVSLEEIKNFLSEKGEKPFRAKQVYEWLWQKSVHSFDDMSNLSISLRDLLKENFAINAAEIDFMQVSSDRTIKTAFKLFDGNVVEGVLIPTTSRMTACISSQVGCSLTCKFCATGTMERLRNLNADEIYDQVAQLRNLALEKYNMPLSNIVYMGMGEPLLNYANVVKSIERITSPDGLNISPQRITVSTAGIAKMIRKLADDNVKFNLALSLHAANDEKRSKLMPINETNSLQSLAEALIYFYGKTETRPTFEYIIFKDFNDKVEDARELAEFCKNIPCKVNVIEYNAIEGGEFQKADDNNIREFCNYLENRNIIVNVRRSRGKDIDAACGQLANKRENKIL